MGGENGERGIDRLDKAGGQAPEPELVLTEKVGDAIARIEAEIELLKKLPTEGAGATSQYHIDDLQRKLDKLREQAAEGGQ